MLKQLFISTPVKEVLADDNTLALVPLVEQCEPFEVGMITTGLEGATSVSLSELWTVSQPTVRGQTGNTYWSKNSDIICIAHWLSKDDCYNIEQNTQKAYKAVLSVMTEHGFSYPFRFWNYLPAINAGTGDDELYKKFCTGRLKAFESAGLTPENFPAASALGHHSDGAVIYMFASNQKPQHFKNNNQVNAYEYPRQYGISSPSFARATALNLNNINYLFISGTASIIGHQTLGENDLEKQLEVTQSNIEHLLTTANPENLSLSTFKVYIRYPQDVAFTQNWLEARYPGVDMLFTIADICRKELLVEIECFCL
ncbi:MAG: dioxygenase [Alteromonadaceae bacterium]|nr:dioxygenase [Alteromonadaceae bacterium]